MLDTLPFGEQPWAKKLQENLDNLWDNQPRVEILGAKSEDNLATIRFRASRRTQWVRVQVQHDGLGGGGVDFNASTYVSSTRVDCRTNREQDITVTPTTDANYIVYLIPEILFGDTYVSYDGIQGDDYMAFLALGRGGVTLADSPNLDAFARLRVSNPVTLFDSQSQYQNETTLFGELVAGAATITHDPNNSAVDLNVTTASGDSAMRQSHEYFHYQPGKSQLVLMTFTLADGQTNMVQEVGYGDDANGCFIEEENGTVRVVLRSDTSGSVVNTKVDQSSWNLDTMDGNGPSGITLDPTKSQILFLDIEWLGVGRVRMGFVMDGIPVYVHEFLHANVGTGVYMRTANLPIRWKIYNTGTTAGSASMKAICSSVISEGGFEESRGFPFSATTPDAGIGSVSTTEVPILAIRPALLFNGITNRVTVRVRRVELFAQSAPVLFRVRYNATVTGGAWTPADANSSVEYNNSASGFSGGAVVDSGFVASNTTGNASAAGGQDVVNDLPFTLDSAGAVPDTILITAVRTGASGTATVGASFFWLEYR